MKRTSAAFAASVLGLVGVAIAAVAPAQALPTTHCANLVAAGPRRRRAAQR